MKYQILIIGFVFLLPDPEVIEKRFKIRGDEIHDFASIMNVWTKFAEATEEFSSYPNVFISHSDSVERISDNLIPYIYLQERQSLLEISEYAKKFVSATKIMNHTHSSSRYLMMVNSKKHL